MSSNSSSDEKKIDDILPIQSLDESKSISSDEVEDFFRNISTIQNKSQIKVESQFISKNPIPDVAIYPTNIHFPTTYPNKALQSKIIISNGGTQTEVFTVSLKGDREFSISTRKITLQPGDTQSIIVSFAPRKISLFNGSLIFEGRTSIVAPITGHCITSPLEYPLINSPIWCFPLKKTEKLIPFSNNSLSESLSVLLNTNSPAFNTYPKTFDLPPSSSIDIKISFDPRQQLSEKTTLSIQCSQSGDSTVIPLVIAPKRETIVVDFGTISVGRKATQTLKLKHPQMAPIVQWPFSFDNISENGMPQNEMVFSFAAREVGDYRSKVAITDYDIELKASAVNPPYRLNIPSHFPFRPLKFQSISDFMIELSFFLDNESFSVDPDSISLRPNQVSEVRIRSEPNDSLHIDFITLKIIWSTNEGKRVVDEFDLPMNLAQSIINITNDNEFISRRTGKSRTEISADDIQISSELHNSRLSSKNQKKTSMLNSHATHFTKDQSREMQSKPGKIDNSDSYDSDDESSDYQLIKQYNSKMGVSSSTTSLSSPKIIPKRSNLLDTYSDSSYNENNNSKIRTNDDENHNSNLQAYSTDLLYSSEEESLDEIKQKRNNKSKISNSQNNSLRKNNISKSHKKYKNMQESNYSDYSSDEKISSKQSPKRHQKKDSSNSHKKMKRDKRASNNRSKQKSHSNQKFKHKSKYYNSSESYSYSTSSYESYEEAETQKRSNLQNQSYIHSSAINPGRNRSVSFGSQIYSQSQVMISTTASSSIIPFFAITPKHPSRFDLTINSESEIEIEAPQWIKLPNFIEPNQPISMVVQNIPSPCIASTFTVFSDTGNIALPILAYKGSSILQFDSEIEMIEITDDQYTAMMKISNTGERCGFIAFTLPESLSVDLLVSPSVAIIQPNSIVQVKFLVTTPQNEFTIPVIAYYGDEIIRQLHAALSPNDFFSTSFKDIETETENEISAYENVISEIRQRDILKLFKQSLKTSKLVFKSPQKPQYEMSKVTVSPSILEFVGNEVNRLSILNLSPESLPFSVSTTSNEVNYTPRNGIAPPYGETVITISLDRPEDSTFVINIGKEVIKVPIKILAPKTFSKKNKSFKNRGQFAVMEDNIEFDCVNVGSSKTMSLIVLNNENHFMNLSLNLDNSAFFCKKTVDIGGNSQQKIEIEFNPKSAGVFNGNLVMQNDDSKIIVHLSGEGINDNESVSSFISHPVEFPVCLPGTIRRARLRVSNRTDQYATVRSEVTPPFQCPYPEFEIEPYSYVLVPIRFIPKKPGDYFGSAEFHSSTGTVSVIELVGSCVDN